MTTVDDLSFCTCAVSKITCPIHGDTRVIYNTWPEVNATGWFCPVCSAVMGPSIPNCVNCVGIKKY
jgi:hypothetical protein